MPIMVDETSTVQLDKANLVFALIDSSFLTDELKEAYKPLLDERLLRL